MYGFGWLVVMLMQGLEMEANQEVTLVPPPPSQPEPEEIERKARVEVVWLQMHKGISMKNLQSILKKQNSTTNKTSQKPSLQSWMTALRLGPKKAFPNEHGLTGGKRTASAIEIEPRNVTSDDAKKLAAAALRAVKDAAVAAAGHGKVEVTEVRDFAGEDVAVKKLIDANSDKGKASVGPASAVDAVLEQIRKKPKLSVLDKTKKDWGEFKDENKGMEEELEMYKKSSNQYLDKVSFLQRADYREFERERDARLAMQSKRKQDMREDEF